MNIVEHSSRGITIIRDMQFSFGQLPYQPSIDSTK